MGRPVSIRAILWGTIGTLTLIIAFLVTREVFTRWHELQQIESLRQATFISDKLFDATEKLSVERDVAFALLQAPDAQEIADLRSRLKDSRREADTAFTDALASMKHYNFPELDALYQNLEKHLADIRAQREEMDKAIDSADSRKGNAMAQPWYDGTSSLIHETQDIWTAFIKHFTGIDPIVTQHLRYKHFLRLITDYSGQERALIGQLLVKNIAPTPEQIGQLLRYQGALDLAWKTAALLADQSGLFPELKPYFNDAQSHYLTMHDMVRDIFYVPGERHGVSYPISADLWFELSTQATDSLTALKVASKKIKHQYLDQLEQQKQKAITLHLAVLLASLFICAYCFWIISRRVIGPINAMVEALVDTTRGNAVSPPAVANPNDEIGKLAHVLHAFQQNMEEIKRTSAALEIYTRALEQSNQDLDDFAYIASHDLKEPLRGLFNHASFLMEDYQDKLDEDGVRRLHRLSDLAQRMERLISDLLYFSRLGRADLAIQDTDLNEVIADIAHMMDAYLKEHHARIILPKPLPHMICDKPRITEVLRNLITNAVKYNDKPDRTVEVGFIEQMMTSKGPEKNVIYVKDNGIGIKQEFFGEIFRIFKKLQSSKEGSEGTGVGLTFVKKIVERHKGRVWLESEPGKGTTFYFNVGGTVL